MRLIVFLILSLLIAGSYPAQAALLGNACTMIGQTQLDTDHLNIISCLCPSGSPNCTTGKWKAMTSKDMTCPSGKYLASVSNGALQCVSQFANLNISCPANYSITSISNGVPQCTVTYIPPPPCTSGVTFWYPGNCYDPATGYYKPCKFYSGNSTTTYASWDGTFADRWTQYAKVVYGTASCVNGKWMCSTRYDMWWCCAGESHPNWSSQYECGN
ncbi:MAG: hypothetical protein WC464_05645 [Bdellovibrionales bacterium]